MSRRQQKKEKEQRATTGEVERVGLRRAAGRGTKSDGLTLPFSLSFYGAILMVKGVQGHHFPTLVYLYKNQASRLENALNLGHGSLGSPSQDVTNHFPSGEN